jgi:GDP-L-fucose synthase
MKIGKVFLAGHNGLVGSAILNKLRDKKISVVTIAKKQLDLRDQKKVEKFFKKNKFEYTIIAAAKVGGIVANQKFKADFIYDNLMIQSNLINSSYKNNVKNLIFLGSSCIYPKYSKLPINEKELLNGKLEETNDAYAIAKIAGVKMCESYNQQYGTNYKCLMPCNIYGPNDNYSTENSHFFPALIKKFYYAKVNNENEVEIWGSGKPKRELLFVEDLANAVIFFMKKKTKDSIINIGNGKDYSIKYYANFIKKKLKLKCRLNFNKKFPDGTFRKVLDTSLSKKYGWLPKINLEKGFKITYQEFIKKNSV